MLRDALPPFHPHVLYVSVVADSRKREKSGDFFGPSVWSVLNQQSRRFRLESQGRNRAQMCREKNLWSVPTCSEEMRHNNIISDAIRSWPSYIFWPNEKFKWLRLTTLQIDNSHTYSYHACISTKEHAKNPWHENQTLDYRRCVRFLRQFLIFYQVAWPFTIESYFSRCIWVR